MAICVPTATDAQVRLPENIIGHVVVFKVAWAYSLSDILKLQYSKMTHQLEPGQHPISLQTLNPSLSIMGQPVSGFRYIIKLFTGSNGEEILLTLEYQF